MLGKGSPIRLAYAMIFSTLRNGYRSLPLLSPSGCPIDACTLFVHIETKPLPPPAETVRAPSAVDSFSETSSRRTSNNDDWSRVRLSVLSLGVFTGSRRRTISKQDVENSLTARSVGAAEGSFSSGKRPLSASYRASPRGGALVPEEGKWPIPDGAPARVATRPDTKDFKLNLEAVHERESQD